MTKRSGLDERTMTRRLKALVSAARLRRGSRGSRPERRANGPFGMRRSGCRIFSVPRSRSGRAWLADQQGGPSATTRLSLSNSCVRYPWTRASGLQTGTSSLASVVAALSREGHRERRLATPLDVIATLLKPVSCNRLHRRLRDKEGGHHPRCRTPRGRQRRDGIAGAQREGCGQPTDPRPHPRR